MYDRPACGRTTTPKEIASLLMELIAPDERTKSPITMLNCKNARVTTPPDRIRICIYIYIHMYMHTCRYTYMLMYMYMYMYK